MSIKDDGDMGVKEYINAYGPFAFGVVSLLAIWFAIVRPELAKRDINYESHQETSGQLERIANAHKDTAQSLEVSTGNVKTTAAILERTAEMLKPKNE